MSGNHSTTDSDSLGAGTVTPPGRARFDAWFDDANAERDRLTERVAELVTEGNGLRAELQRYRQALEAIAKSSEGYDPGTNEHAHHSAAAAALSARPPAVVTAGTGHLAAAITRLAIPDEED